MFEERKPKRRWCFTSMELGEHPLHKVHMAGVLDMVIRRFGLCFGL